MTARPWPHRYTRAKLATGAKGFLFVPRVGEISSGTIDAFGWVPPFFDDEDAEIREDGVNLGSLPEDGDTAVPALPEDSKTTRELRWNETFEQWDLKRRPPPKFTNLDWRGQAGDPNGPQEVLHFWGPPNRYWGGGGAYPPYTDGIYRRGSLYLRAPGHVCGCAIHKANGIVFVACMTPQGGAYAAGNITHDKLYVRIVRGPHATQDSEDTALFAREDFDALVAEFNSATLVDREQKKQEVIAYSQRWHEIDLRDHQDLVDETIPPSQQAADHERTEAELFPWHFNGSGTECQTLRRTTAHIVHPEIEAKDGGQFDLREYRYDRLKIGIQYDTETVTLNEGTEIVLVDPTIAASRIPNNRVPMWAATDDRVEEDYADNVGWFPFFTGAFPDNVIVGTETRSDCPDVSAFTHNLSFDPDSIQGVMQQMSLDGHLTESTGLLLRHGGTREEPAGSNLRRNSVLDNQQRSQSGIVVAVDYQGDTEILATVDYTETITASHELIDSNINNWYVTRKVLCSFDPETELYDVDYALDLESGSITAIDPSLKLGTKRDARVDYSLVVTLHLSAGDIDLHNESVNTLYQDTFEGFVLDETGAPGHHIEHMIVKVARSVDHLDLRNDLLVYTEQSGDVEQSALTDESTDPVSWSATEFTTSSGLPKWYYYLEILETGTPLDWNRVADETFQEQVVLWQAGTTSVLSTQSFVPAGRESESFSDRQPASEQLFQFRSFFIGNEALADPKLVGRFLAETQGGSDQYVSGEEDRQAMPVEWELSTLGGWAVDNQGQAMLSQMAAFNASELQYKSSDPDDYEDDEVRAVNFFAGGDLVALNELVIPSEQHAAFFNCVFAGD